MLAAAARHESRLAIEMEGTRLTYGEMLELASRIGATIQGGADAESGRVGLYGGRSLATYTALLGTLLAGNAYVPLSLTFPPRYNRQLIERAEVVVLAVDKEGLRSLPALLERLERPLTVLLPDSSVPRQFEEAFPQHTFLGEDTLAESNGLRARDVDENELA